MNQMLEFLNDNLKAALKHLNLNRLYELRLRVGKPVAVNYEGKYRYLSERGLTDKASLALTVTKEEIEGIVFSAGNFSVYSVEEQIKRGFVTAGHGERIGLAGQYVFERGVPITVRDFTSLCIRVPHEIEGCSDEIYRKCLMDSLKNLLILSPPGLGKTTILRDLSRRLSEERRINLLICDERGEISVGDTGATSDVLLFADKATAFDAGLRTMRPDVIVTDELTAEDYGAVKRAVFGGVKVIASAHFSDMSRVPKELNDVFERFVFLDTEKIGKIGCIYG